MHSPLVCMRTRFDPQQCLFSPVIHGSNIVCESRLQDGIDKTPSPSPSPITHHYHHHHHHHRPRPRHHHPPSPSGSPITITHHHHHHHHHHLGHPSPSPSPSLYAGPMSCSVGLAMASVGLCTLANKPVRWGTSHLPISTATVLSIYNINTHTHIT